MIEELYIRNVALIDELQLEFSPHLNVLTGETGAGKSVILNAIGLVLGERSAADIVRADADKAVIQIAINLTENNTISQRLREAELIDEDFSEDVLIVARQISPAGRSRCSINNQMVSLKQMSELGDGLVDIHGQHEHQSLFRSETHLELLDAFGNLESLKAETGKKFADIQRTQHQLSDFTRKLREAVREKEFLEFQLQELDDARLQPDEEATLAHERQLLNNAETLFESANQVYEQLYGGRQTEFAIVDALKAVATSVAKLSHVDNGLSPINERLNSALYELEDIAHQIRDYRDGVEFNPQRLAEVEERLDLIYRLKRKYGDSVQEILDYQRQAAQTLRELELGAEQVEKLEAEIRNTTLEAQKLAVELSSRRKQTAKVLETEIEKELHTLGMEKAVFKVIVCPEESPDGLLKIEGRRYVLKADGMDTVEFLISPNVGAEPKPLAKIASGGEISRVMLALKTALNRIDQIPTQVYDEIDVGIGGRTADIIGEKLKRLSKQRQVICITHLPQIARFADRHFRVEKHVIGTRTVISAKQLTDEERIDEIARMHGGEATVTTLAHARELLLSSRR